MEYKIELITRNILQICKLSHKISKIKIYYLVYIGL